MAVMAGCLFPGAALAGTGGDGGFSFTTCLLQMFSSLAVVLGAIYLLAYLGRRTLTGIKGGNGLRTHIRVVESRCLAPKKSLLLVEVAGEYLLLSSDADGISLIKQIDMVEEAEVIEVVGREVTTGEKFQARLEGFMGNLTLPRLSAAFSRSEG